MYIGVTIDVFIGLALMYVFLSLFVSSVNEAIAQFLRLRARSLKRAIRMLLTDGGKRDVSIFENFKQHVLVAALSKQKETKGKPEVSDKEPNILQKIWRFLRSEPSFSYIPSRVFAVAAIEASFIKSDKDQGKEGQGSEHNPESVSNSLMVESYDHLNIGDVDINTLVNELPPGALKNVALSALNNGAKSLDDVRKHIEKWFDDTMDRLSGWYTRTSRVVALVLALVIAVVLNVDTLYVANAFWKEPALRQAAVDYAAAHASDTTFVDSMSGVGFEELKTEMAALQLPIGWGKDGPNQDITGKVEADKDVGWLERAWCVFLHRIIGWLLTALAISLGGHFWFDMLNKFVRIRSANAPKPETKKNTDVKA
jgi:hypothetical protein